MNKNFTLFPFQEDAVSELVSSFKTLWTSKHCGAPLIFKAPTGSGKTIMMAQFLKDLARDPQFDVDKCFVWISFGGDNSYKQSHNKLFHFYDGAGEIQLLDANDLFKKKMGKNSVFFINWAKIKASNKEGRILRAASEHTMRDVDGGVFDEFIINTQKEREIALIVDESHLEKDSNLADEVINLIKPKIQMHVSATPKNIPTAEDAQAKKAGFVSVEHSKVVKAGLIKEQVISQSKEDILSHGGEGNIDEILLDLAYEKRIELKKHYEELGITDINPLVLIQIPNRTNVNKELDEETRQTIIKDYLKDKNIKDFEIATWLSEKKENLEKIVKNNSDVSFLIFKQAVATGWDCPRAQVLVMYREIKNPTFHIQTVGRILRMPEAKHYPISALNQGYLFTNYKKNEIHENEEKLGANKLADQKSKRKENIEPIKIKSIYLQRQDYNDLKPSPKFQVHLASEFDRYFETKKNFTLFNENIEKAKKKGLNCNTKKLSLEIIVNAKIENYDNLIEQMQEANEMGISVSEYDTGLIYNKLCYAIIQKQENEMAKYAPERSWGTLKSALNVWVMNRLTDERDEAYNMIVNDFLQEDSALKKAIEKVLISFRPITSEFLGKQSERKKQEKELEIPPKEDYFTQDYRTLGKLELTLWDKNQDLKEPEKSALIPFYINQNASQPEKNFIQYLEEKEAIEWWYKNGDKGEKYFSVPYNNNKSLFYPDWFIKLKNGQILILDTKGGFTAKDAKDRIEALHKFLKNEQLKGFTAGIVVQHSGIWKVNTSKVYNYDENCSEFSDLAQLV